MRMIGLMSGTSADAIDVAIVDWPESAEARPFELIAYRELRHPESLQAEIHRLAAGELPATAMLAELVRLDRVIAEVSAEAVLGLLAESGIAPDQIAGIASHGQTIAHHPEHGGSLQIGCPARIAERIGRPVIADFRRRDLAMGGEGAPLAPFFHHAVFADAVESRGILNLGGIGNLTWLPAGAKPEAVMAFDVGPANALIDAVVSLETGGRERFDRDGIHARAGRPIGGWLDELLADPYLDRRPPKSTGRERYGLAQARGLLARSRREGIAFDDLVATLVAFSSRAIARAWQGLCGEDPAAGAGRLLVGGGGARNPAFLASLAEALPDVILEPMDRFGVPADAAEAMAFSLMGRNRLLGLPNQLPQCTGVTAARSLGVVHEAPDAKPGP